MEKPRRLTYGQWSCNHVFYRFA